LSRYARQKNIDDFSSSDIFYLWVNRLLRADAIIAPTAMSIPGITQVRVWNDISLYVDSRQPEAKRRDHDSCDPEDPLYNKISLYFHPFRIYVLYQLQKAFRLKLSAMQYFRYPEAAENLVRCWYQAIDQKTSGESFKSVVDQWNLAAEAAIVTEPASYGKVFGYTRWNLGETEETIKAKRDDYLRTTLCAIDSSNLHELEDVREGLCSAADIVDENKVLHVLLRLTKWHRKDELKSAIGLARVFLSMAEIIRRVLESNLKVCIPEEDELGLGQWMKGARRVIYGTNRVLDAPRTQIREFVSGIGIDYGTKVRCYLEGDTDYGAIHAVVGELSGIEIINLRAQFVEKGGRGLAFRDSLRRDNTAGVFSFVFLDGDRTDHVRVVKKAAHDDLFCGRFYIARPDFELANFGIDELCRVMLTLAERCQILGLPDARELETRLGDISSAARFFEKVKALCPQLRNFGKSEEWGRELMRFAFLNPHLRDGSKRQVVDATEHIMRALQCGYRHHRDAYRVNSESGELDVR
jgi:hypothetical protein